MVLQQPSVLKIKLANDSCLIIKTTWVANGNKFDVEFYKIISGGDFSLFLSFGSCKRKNFIFEIEMLIYSTFQDFFLVLSKMKKQPISRQAGNSALIS